MNVRSFPGFTCTPFIGLHHFSCHGLAFASFPLKLLTNLLQFFLKNKARTQGSFVQVWLRFMHTNNSANTTVLWQSTKIVNPDPASDLNNWLIIWQTYSP